MRFAKDWFRRFVSFWFSFKSLKQSTKVLLFWYRFVCATIKHRATTAAQKRNHSLVRPFLSNHFRRVDSAFYNFQFDFRLKSTRVALFISVDPSTINDFSDWNLRQFVVCVSSLLLAANHFTFYLFGIVRRNVFGPMANSVCTETTKEHRSTNKKNVVKCDTRRMPKRIIFDFRSDQINNEILRQCLHSVLNQTQIQSHEQKKRNICQSLFTLWQSNEILGDREKEKRKSNNCESFIPSRRCSSVSKNVSSLSSKE